MIIHKNALNIKHCKLTKKRPERYTSHTEVLYKAPSPVALDDSVLKSRGGESTQSPYCSRGNDSVKSSDSTFFSQVKVIKYGL